MYMYTTLFAVIYHDLHWFVLFFRKIDTKLDFTAKGIFHLSLSTAGCFGGYLLSIFNNKMNCLLSESIDFHRP